MEIDHLLSAPRLYERRITCGSASCSQSTRASELTDGAGHLWASRGSRGGAHSHSSPPTTLPPPPLLSPGPQEPQSGFKKMEMFRRPAGEGASEAAGLRSAVRIRRI